ncbi:hypothetical protein GCM10010335_67680 [Streptomyces galbus]|nr:hypothetical protein GCM10010335_67680 [Streptomyces galbus]
MPYEYVKVITARTGGAPTKTVLRVVQLAGIDRVIVCRPALRETPHPLTSSSTPRRRQSHKPDGRHPGMSWPLPEPMVTTAVTPPT